MSQAARKTATPAPRPRQPARLYRLRPTFDDLQPPAQPDEEQQEEQPNRTPDAQILTQHLRNLGFTGASLFVDRHPHDAIWEAILETTFEERPGYRVPRAMFRNPPGIIAWLVNERQQHAQSKGSGDLRRSPAHPRSQP